MNVVLLGDSIFDNKAYVGAGSDVIEQLGAALSSGSTATLAALDGATAGNITGQLEAVPKDATRLILSVGGNDALQEKGLIEEKAHSSPKCSTSSPRSRARSGRLRGDARRCAGSEAADRGLHPLRGALAGPTTRAISATGFSVFNDVILREAFQALPVIDLRLIIYSDADSPTTSSLRSQGGGEVAKVVATLVTTQTSSNGALRFTLRLALGFIGRWWSQHRAPASPQR